MLNISPHARKHGSYGVAFVVFLHRGISHCIPTRVLKRKSVLQRACITTSHLLCMGENVLLSGKESYHRFAQVISFLCVFKCQLETHKKLAALKLMSFKLFKKMFFYFLKRMLFLLLKNILGRHHFYILVLLIVQVI